MSETRKWFTLISSLKAEKLIWLFTYQIEITDNLKMLLVHHFIVLQARLDPLWRDDPAALSDACNIFESPVAAPTLSATCYHVSHRFGHAVPHRDIVKLLGEVFRLFFDRLVR